VAWQTQPALALALVAQARAWGVPFAWGVAAAGDGDHPPFLPGLDDRQIAYVVGGSSPCDVRLPAAGRPAALVLPSRPRGRGQPQKPRPALRAAARAVLALRPADRWPAITWRADADGVLRTQFVAVRVHWATGGAPCSTSPHRVRTGPEGGLRGERPLPGAHGDRTWSFSPLPADTPRHCLVALAHSCWPIAPGDEDAKGAWGLDHDQGRRWDGLHRHRARVRLAYRFLARQRWTPTDSGGFSPLRGAPVVPGGPAPGAPVALPGCRVMAYRHQSNCSLPPQADLTK